MAGRHEDLDHDGIADAAQNDHRLGATVPPEARDDPYLSRAAVARPMTSPVIYGVDIHPTYQAGISIEKIAAEGFAWLAVKASQGVSVSWSAAADAWLRRGEAAGLVSFPYHYLTDTAAPDLQAHAAKTAAMGRPIMVDFESGSGSVDNLRAFISNCAALGVRVALAYVPRWYWQQIGSPSLAGLPPIVSSRYLTVTGYASSIFSQVPASFWESYGGGTTTVLQFSDRASVAGYKVDVNAFRGTADQFRALVHSTPQEGGMASVPEIGQGIWNWPIDDPYTLQGGDWMPAFAALSWAAANAAHARDEAAAAKQAVADLTEALRTAGVIA